MTTLLITRPAEDAGPLAERLHVLGIDSVLAPLMEVVALPGPALDLGGVAGFLVTSANGARALAARTPERALPVHAVGEASADAARAEGFRTVSSAGGDVETLSAHVAATCRAKDGTLLHAAGSVTAGDLAGALAAHGFRVRVERLYEARAVTALPPDAETALRAGALDGVMLYSPRTAKLFDDLVSKAGLTEALSRLRLFALSANVDAASKAPWAARHVAVTPDQESLLQQVRSCYPH